MSKPGVCKLLHSTVQPRSAVAVIRKLKKGLGKSCWSSEKLIRCVGAVIFNTPDSYRRIGQSHLSMFTDRFSHSFKQFKQNRIDVERSKMVNADIIRWLLGVCETRSEAAGSKSWVFKRGYYDGEFVRCLKVMCLGEKAELSARVLYWLTFYSAPQATALSLTSSLLSFNCFYLKAIRKRMIFHHYKAIYLLKCVKWCVLV